MFEIKVTKATNIACTKGSIEIVERKGIGHPDTICDALADELGLALCRYYRDRFGLIFHHNVDKALLLGGVSEPQFNGGRIIKPMEIFFAGRATLEFEGESVPVEELLVETTRHWLKTHMHALDAERQVILHTLVRPGSSDLVDLYLRQQKTGIALANDTSCGVGYAPLDQLERIVYAVETKLNTPTLKTKHPEIGEDIKVMGVRMDDSIHLTVACAFIDCYIKDISDYFTKKVNLEKLIKEIVGEISEKEIFIEVNTADGKEKESIYLTVTGTSAESGDDGEVGRGNRVNGLITPYRPMNMEAAAGKNPITHVGKLYNIAAHQIAASIVQELPVVKEVQCYLVSRIGHPITEPQVVDLRVQLHENAAINDIRAHIQDITSDHLSRLMDIQDQQLSGAIKVY